MANEHALPDAETLAYTMIEEVTDTVGQDYAQDYLIRVVAEVMQLESGVREWFSDALLSELKEEIARREDSRCSHATVTLISEIEEDWRQES